MKERILESLTTAKYLADVEHDHLLSYVISIAILQTKERMRRENTPGSRRDSMNAKASMPQGAMAS